MTLTKAKALLICYSLWSWLAKTGHDTKEDWPGWKKWGKMKENCPCCEYVIRYHNTCSKCPLIDLWPRNCQQFSTNDTSWEKWMYASSKETRKKYAAVIRNAAQKAYHKAMQED